MRRNGSRFQLIFASTLPAVSLTGSNWPDRPNAKYLSSAFYSRLLAPGGQQCIDKLFPILHSFLHSTVDYSSLLYTASSRLNDAAIQSSEANDNLLHPQRRSRSYASIHYHPCHATYESANMRMSILVPWRQYIYNQLTDLVDYALMTCLPLSNLSSRPVPALSCT